MDGAPEGHMLKIESINKTWSNLKIVDATEAFGDVTLEVTINNKIIKIFVGYRPLEWNKKGKSI